MSEALSLSAGIAGRYATALFELAQEAGALDAVEADAAALIAALGDSADLRALIASPIYSREDQGRAMAALADRMGLSDLMTRTIGLMAAKRRLFVLPRMLAALKAMIARARGEVTARVISARPLNDAQRAELSRTLGERTGQTVVLEEIVDEALIGGLVVRVGSTMIDTSIRSKLANLQTLLKEAG